jgi:hypothetical protein
LLEAAGVSGVYDASGELEIVNNEVSRAWLVAAACWHTNEDSLTQAMLSPAWQPSQQIHLLGDGSCAEATDDIQGTVDVVEAGANAVGLQVNAYRDNWLVLADAYYPGWVAMVDGEETYIYRTNLMFRAIQVSAGEHTVRFEYRPSWLFPGIFVSVVSALGLLLIFRLRSELQID